MSTARTVPWADYATSPTDYGFWAPTTQVGAGLVDAGRVLTYTTELNFNGRKFELNDTANFIGMHVVDITNHGKEAVTYQFALQDAAGYESYNPVIPGETKSFIPSVKFYYDLIPVKMTPEVIMPQEKFKVEPGETKKAKYVFSATRLLPVNTLLIYVADLSLKPQLD
jgi:hypothetical protein